MIALRYVYVLALSIWFGGIIIIGGVATPVSDEVLHRFFVVSYVAGGLLLVAIAQAMEQRLRGHGYAKSVLDVACWDLLGRIVAVPCYVLLGGLCQERFPLYVAVPLGPAAEMAEVPPTGTVTVTSTAPAPAGSVVRRTATATAGRAPSPGRGCHYRPDHGR